RVSKSHEPVTEIEIFYGSMFYLAKSILIGGRFLLYGNPNVSFFSYSLFYPSILSSAFHFQDPKWQNPFFRFAIIDVHSSKGVLFLLNHLSQSRYELHNRECAEMPEEEALAEQQGCLLKEMAVLIAIHLMKEIKLIASLSVLDTVNAGVC
ncbi:hypothetical protein M8C21_005900, partial [Ambrosia artemisiifolia]